MNHADRCQFWKRPANQEDWLNSLHDAFATLPPGKMLVYRIDLPGNKLAGDTAPENRMAQNAADKMGGALVQWPVEPSHGDKMATRKWIYAIQKPTQVVAS